MGILPFPFLFTAYDRRHVTFPFWYERLPVVLRKRYPLSYKATTFHKSYHFYCKAQPLIARLDDEQEAARIVVQPISVEQPLHARRQSQLVNMYIHQTLLAEAVRHQHIQHDDAAYASVPPVLIDVSPVLYASGQKTASIHITTAQASSLLRVVESRFHAARYATGYQVLRTLLTQQQHAVRHDAVSLHKETEQQVATNRTLPLGAPATHKEAARIIQPRITPDEQQMATCVSEQAITPAQVNRATRLVTNVVVPNTEIIALKGAFATHKDSEVYGLSERTYTLACDIEQQAHIDTEKPMSIDAALCGKKNVQHDMAIEAEQFVERQVVHKANIEQTDAATRRLQRALDVDVKKDMRRDVTERTHTDSPLQAERHVTEQARVEREQEAQRIYQVALSVDNPQGTERRVIERVTIERTTYSQRLPLLEMLREAVRYGKRLPLHALAPKDTTTHGVSIEVIEAEVDEPTSAVLWELLDAYVDEAQAASSFEVFITDVIEHLDAHVIDELLTEVEEDITAGTPEEERKKKLIWLIMGRPSWIMQWNQWKKTR